MWSLSLFSTARRASSAVASCEKAWKAALGEPCPSGAAEAGATSGIASADALASRISAASVSEMPSADDVV